MTGFNLHYNPNLHLDLKVNFLCNFCVCVFVCADELVFLLYVHSSGSGGSAGLTYIHILTLTHTHTHMGHTQDLSIWP